MTDAVDGSTHLSPEIMQSPPLRLLTYNVHDLLDDADAVAHVLRCCRPDVACLQEVPRRPLTRHRVRRLARESGLRWAAGGRGSGGTAVFTSRRVDVLEGRTGSLPVRTPLTRTRGYALARVQWQGAAPVTVVSVHLPLHEGDRLTHVRAVLAAAGAGVPRGAGGGAGGGAGALVVAGDLNEPPSGPAWAVLRERLLDAGPACPPTYPARAPRARIDGVLVSPELAVVTIGVAGPAEGLWPADLRAASDHLPVIATLRLPPPA